MSFATPILFNQAAERQYADSSGAFWLDFCSVVWSMQITRTLLILQNHTANTTKAIRRTG